MQFSDLLYSKLPIIVLFICKNILILTKFDIKI